jgi:2''-5'' RNA ligase
MRLFVGIPLASEVLNELSEAVARLSSPNDNLRWTTPETWHITLQFLGNTDGQHCDCILERLSEVHAPPFTVQLGELGFFDRAGVFFVDVVPTAELAALAKSVNAVTARCGFAAETRPYHPHITLARAKGEERGKALRALQDRIGQGEKLRREASANPPVRDETAKGCGPWALSVERTSITGFTASEFLLYESFTRQEGAKYEVRRRFRLGTAH